jgi:signal transduction histidine kinase
VTERETMRQEILAQRDRLEEANVRLIALDREKTEVLGIAAHDLRSPICNIRSICDLIPGKDSETVQMTSLIGSTADSLLTLLSNLLDLDRIERGQLELELRTIAVAPIVRNIAEQFYAAAKEKQMEVRVAECDESINALADESSFRRILQNLVSNALKFSPIGATIEIGIFRIENKVRVEVKDQGPGISDADRKSLFGRFARLSARPTAGESSSGLGLSIVKHLVDAMNGQVGCDSTPGKGATFWFEILVSHG